MRRAAREGRPALGTGLSGFDYCMTDDEHGAMIAYGHSDLSAR